MSGKVCIALILFLLGGSLHAQEITEGAGEEAWLLKRDRWVDSVMNSLDDEEKLGQLFMVAAYSNRDDDHFKELRKLVERQGIGGLIFFQGGPVRQALITNELQAEADVPLFIAMDAEWGLGMRLDSIPDFPRQMTLGAIQDNQLIYTMGAEIARQLKLLGVHINFAPVVDVNSNPENPVIGTRSFGEYKMNVARKGIAYMRGLQHNGVLASAKHFPGHGDTDTDSHLTLPVIRHNMERLKSVELYPFEQLIKDSLASIMVAHLHVPALDNRPNVATTLSPAAVNDLLKKEIGYKGLIFTDALNMKGVSNFYEPGEVDVEAFKAGNDILLFSEDVPDAIRKLKRAIRRGEIDQKEVDERVRKILMAKYWAGLHNYQPTDTANLVRQINEPVSDLIRQKLYEHSTTVVRNSKEAIPIRRLEERNFASVAIGGAESAEATAEFSRMLNEYAPFTHYSLPENATGQEIEALYQKLMLYDYVVVGVQGMKRSAKEQFGLTDAELTFISKLKRKPNIIFSVFGSPYSLKYFEEAPHLIVAYEDNTYTRKIVPAIIFGGLRAKGELPVTVSGLLRRDMGEATRELDRLSYATPEDVGLDSKVLANIDEIVKEAIEIQATPGAQVLVARKGSIVYHKSFGHLSYDSLQPVNNQTIYDIASITKVAATLQVMMFLEERGLVELDKPIVTYLEDLKGSNKANLTLRNILTHQAGLVPYIPFWKNTVTETGLNQDFYSAYPIPDYNLQVASGIYAANSLQDSIWQWIKHSELLPLEKGKKKHEYKYSDVGYYIMQRIAEKTLNQPMAAFLSQNIYEPLGLTTMTYLPLCKFPMERIAPTEQDNYFRNSLVCGMVHDQGAAMFGGIAGHAGVFSNARDLATLLQMNLQDGVYGGRKFLAPGTVSRFSKKQFEDNRRGLGWDKPALDEFYGPASNLASPSTFGHTGFTGTAAWVDPEFDLVYIFLSNRIHPDAGNTKLIRYNFRTRIQDEIYKAMQSFNKYKLVP
ncbi:glycoside hydrolase family 3 N-terminal domain-containing protein [Nafulsella turpanensis]|uniref:glycoside hydrolase family 3 N-terminal domain-containing protein n=1 Tax=Nafulsella turpanensis TaxID=1265690 RepID=UPI0003463A06|nr:glycoside hydrolase family 3 N-terminal domain-containing protein [Nafulsella turpanensis]